MRRTIKKRTPTPGGGKRRRPRSASWGSHCHLSFFLSTLVVKPAQGFVTRSLGRFHFGRRLPLAKPLDPDGTAGMKPAARRGIEEARGLSRRHRLQCVGVFGPGSECAASKAWV